MTPHLTVSVGLRYDVHISPITEDWNPFFADPSAYPVDKNNIQPRIGVAYSTSPTSVIRGGYGMFYEKQWIDRFENYSLNRVDRTRSWPSIQPVRRTPVPATAISTDPFLVNGPVLDRALLDKTVPPGSLSRNTGVVWLDTPDRVLPSQQQGSIGYERQIGRSLSAAVDFMHIQNGEQPLRYNLNPGIKATTGRTAPAPRQDIQNVAGQLGITPFSSDVWIVEYIGETRYDGLTMQIEKRFSGNWGARFSYGLGYGRGNTNGTPTATNDFQVPGRA